MTKQTKPDIAAVGRQDMGVLRDAELNGVSGGIIIVGGLEALGGPDTRWAAASAQLFRVAAYRHQ
jgi:hypothetical protein